MPQNYVPIFVFLLVAFMVAAGTLVVATLVRPSNPEKVKGMAYECGIEAIDDARQRYTVRFYIVAILFVVFDVETIFPVSMGGPVQTAWSVWLPGDADLSRNPRARLRVGMEEGRAGVDLEPPAPAGSPERWPGNSLA